jgi:DNA polymerase I-like protein with 3'-5' exonuclease and polymerase domains
MSALPDWGERGLISLDTETSDPTLRELGPGVRREGRMVGISFATTTERGWYLPFGHPEDNLDPDQVRRYMQAQLKRFRGEITGANLQYDIDYLMEWGLEFHPDVTFRDTQVAEPLLNELKFSYSLNSILKDWGFDLKDDQGMIEAAKAYGMKKDNQVGAWISDLPGRYVGPYAERDATAPLQLIRAQEAEIDKQDLRKVYDLECAVQPVLVKMRRRGVKVDFDQLMHVETYCSGKRAEAADFIDNLTTIGFTPGDFDKKELLVRILNEVGIPFSMSESLDADWLRGNADKHPMIPMISQGRKHNKMVSTFVQQVKDYQVNGRVHCSFNQLRRSDDDGKNLRGAAYGRLSSQDPNMQQQPARDPEVGTMWRRVYVPDDGAQWACLDYSQQEPRLLAHCAEVVGVPGGEEAAQKYRDDPDMDNHDMMTEMVFGLKKEETDPKDWKFKRGQCKIIFLGLCYNMGEVKLCNDLGLPTKVIEYKGRMMRVAGDEGKQLFNRFHKRVPMVAALQTWCDKRARKNGFIRTLSGRKCRFPRAKDGLNWDWTNKALNRLIQGGAGDQTKTAMVDLDRAGYPLQLQVHDEFDFSVPDRAYAEGAAEIMKTCVDLNVPSKVDVELGPNWGDVS